MLYSLILSSMLGQSQVSTSPTLTEVEHHDVLAPIQVIPTRTLRKNILGAEIGWNSLTGLGLLYSRNIVPHFALDASAGVSLARGGEFGLRGRWNILTGNLTPFIGLGFLYGTGWPNPLDKKDVQDGDKVVQYSFKVDRSPMAQGSVGLAWQNRHGFSLMGMLGWTQLMRASNVKLVQEHNNYQFTKSDEDALKMVISSGPTIALNIGYAF